MIHTEWAIFGTVALAVASPGPDFAMVVRQKLVLGAWLPVATFAWFAFVATMLSHEGLRRSLRRAAHWIERVMGVVLIALGADMLVELLR